LGNPITQTPRKVPVSLLSLIKIRSLSCLHLLISLGDRKKRHYGSHAIPDKKFLGRGSFEWLVRTLCSKTTQNYGHHY